MVRSSLAAETNSMTTCMEHLDWMRTLWSQMTTAEFSLDSYEGAEKKKALLVTDCKSLCDAIHKEGAAPSSTDQRLALELAIVKSRATEGEADLRWIDTRYQIAECLTQHASRKSVDVLQQENNQAPWRITAEETMLETRWDETVLRLPDFGGTRVLKFVQCLICPQRNPHVCDRRYQTATSAIFATGVHMAKMPEPCTRSTMQRSFLWRQTQLLAVLVHPVKVMSVSTVRGNKNVDKSRALWHKRGLNSVEPRSLSHMFPLLEILSQWYSTTHSSSSKRPSLVVSCGYGATGGCANVRSGVTLWSPERAKVTDVHLFPWSTELRSLHTCRELDVIPCCVRGAITIMFTANTL